MGKTYMADSHLFVSLGGLVCLGSDPLLVTWDQAASMNHAPSWPPGVGNEPNVMHLQQHLKNKIESKNKLHLRTAERTVVSMLHLEVFKTPNLTHVPIFYLSQEHLIFFVTFW